MIQFRCPECRKTVKLADDLGGKASICPNRSCAKALTVPEPLRPGVRRCLVALRWLFVPCILLLPLGVPYLLVPYAFPNLANDHLQ